MITVKVLIWGMEVGVLSWDRNAGKSYFVYNPEFVKSGLEIAPLTAPLSKGRAMIPVYSPDERTFQNLPAFISDSLPDSWGNELFEQWRRKQRISRTTPLPLEKLSFIGKRGMGALEFVPEKGPRHYYHLFACIDGRNVRRIITSSSPDYQLIASAGTHGLSAGQLQALVIKYFLNS